MLSLPEIEEAARIVHAAFAPTPQYAWPLLAERLGAEVWVKHENHTPTGAFKVRGGLTFFDRLRQRGTQVRGVISATRGNHGQSLAYAGARAGVPVRIVVPHGNSAEKNAAMRALGATLVEHGADFDAARIEAARMAEVDGLLFAPSFHANLVAGVATYSLELLRAVPDLDVLYVPIGLGSGICGAIVVRDLLGLRTEIVGVQSTGAPAYAESLKAGRVVETPRADTFADGMATRMPDPAAFAMIRAGVARIVTVTDAEVAAAIRVLWTDTHNLAEGAGAAALAAAMQEKASLRGRRVGAVLSGGNIDLATFRQQVYGDEPMTSLLVKNVRPLGGHATDVLIRDGRIAAIGTSLELPAHTPVEDGGGALLLPALIEGHTHLDKTLWHLKEWVTNDVGPAIQDKIDNERTWRATHAHDAGEASLAMAKLYLASGTTRIRSFVDIDTEAGLRHLHGILTTRRTIAGAQEIQVVAFPQSGLLVRPGTDALLDAAMAEGADIVGGLDPCAIDRDPVRHLDVVFGIAQKHGKPVDVHLHEPGEMGAFSLELMLERTEALGMAGKVVVSHGFCLGMIGERERDALLDRMARLDVAIATTAPPSRPVPLAVPCRRAGVHLFGGNDGVRDTWNPYGKPDMLDRAMLIGLRNNFRRDEEIGWALECVTAEGARGCGFTEYGLAEGCRAEFALVDARSVAEAVVAQPVRKLVVSGGRIVARDGRLVAGL